MYILNRSFGEEIVRSSLARAGKAAPKKRRRARRNRVGSCQTGSCQTGLQRNVLNRRGCSQKEARSGLQRITTQLHHTLLVQHLHHFPLHQRHLSPHNLSQMWCRLLVCSPTGLRLEANITTFSNALFRSCACACLAEIWKIRRVRRDSSRRSAESGTCHTRQRLDGDRAA